MINVKKINKDDCGFICYAVVIIFLIITLIIFLSDDYFFKKVNESSGLASWFQGVGTLVAVYSVWWQTRKQIDSVKDARIEEELKRKNDTFVRSKFILDESRVSCERIIEFHNKFILHQKHSLAYQSMKASIGMGTFGGSDISSPNYQQYKDALSTTVLHLLNIPYWDISDSHYANKLLKIQSQARLCILILDYEPTKFINALEELINRIKFAENS